MSPTGPPQLSEQNQELINVNHKLRLGKPLTKQEEGQTGSATVLASRLQSKLDDAGRTYTTPAEVDALQDEVSPYPKQKWG